MLNLSGYKPSDRYMLRSLHGTYYLIPTGQDIAMHRNAIKLNDTGLIIWDAITNGIPMDKIPSVIRQRLTADSLSFDACYKIGGLTTGFIGCTDCLDISLEDFRTDIPNGDVDQLWRLCPLIDMPEFDGRMIIHTVQLELFESGGWYVMTFPSNRHLLMCRITTDGTAAEFFYDHRDMPEALSLIHI